VFVKVQIKTKKQNNIAAQIEDNGGEETDSEADPENKDNRGEKDKECYAIITSIQFANPPNKYSSN
jgi:hypothetical protein